MSEPNNFSRNFCQMHELSILKTTLGAILLINYHKILCMFLLARAKIGAITFPNLLTLSVALLRRKYITLF